uniref:Hemerythrin n=1 Tax=Glottidia pyramidata TaxID=34515 RepID=A0A286RT40_GLOPY|nr:hemerythrin [Glottidia pyramidata]
MGFDIPEPFVWDKSFEVFYKNLDDEHKKIFEAIFECAKQRGDGALLGNLIQVCKDHFKEEEGMMQASTAYGDFDAHKKKHDAFIEKISSLSCPLDDASVIYAKDWLVNHIKGTDFTYKGKLTPNS